MAAGAVPSTGCRCRSTKPKQKEKDGCEIPVDWWPSPNYLIFMCILDIIMYVWYIYIWYSIYIWYIYIYIIYIYTISYIYILYHIYIYVIMYTFGPWHICWSWFPTVLIPRTPSHGFDSGNGKGSPSGNHGLAASNDQWWFNGDLMVI